MSQSPVIFLVDLPEQEAELGKTLSRSGFTPRFIGSDQVGLGLTEVIPQAMIAPHLKAEEIAAALRAIDLDVEIPFFVMAPESAGTHVKGSMPREVTAVVRDDIDPGILSLRLKAATQQLPTRRGHSPTLMGFVPPQASKPSTSASIPAAPFSSPPVAPSTPPAAAPLGSVPPATPLGSIPPSPSIAPTAGRPVPPVSSTSTPPPAGLQTLPTDPLATNSAPPPAAEARAASTLPAPPSTPPAAVSTPPEAAAIPLAAAATIPPEAVATPPVQFATNEAITSASQSVAPAAVRSVAPAANLDTDIDYNHASSKARGKKIALAAAALVILGGATLLMRGKDQAAVSTTQAPVAAAPPSEATPAPAHATPEVAAPAPAPAPVEEQAPQAEASNELYKISGATTLDDCDKVLDKPESYYQKQASWRGAQAWKSARTYLVQGKNELAFAQMCQSALIDPSGQAIPGLVNYFLRARAIDQALAWAEKGAAASKSGRSAKEALGDVLSQQGKVDEARKLWLETAKLTEDKTARIEAVARNWVKSAKQARRGGDLALAERLLRRAATFDSNNPEVALLLAQTLSKNDQPELAKNWAKKALELDPKAEGVQEIIDGK